MLALGLVLVAGDLWASHRPLPVEPVTPSLSEAAPAQVTARRRKKRKRRGKGKGKKKPKRGKSKRETTKKQKTTTQAPAIETPTTAPELPKPPPLPKDHVAVAVLPPMGFEVDELTLHNVATTLLTEVDEAVGMQGVSPRDVSSDLKRFGLQPDGCEGKPECVARAGRYARCHFALSSSIAALGGTLSLSMRLVDTTKRQEVARVADTISDDPAERARELHRMAVQLLSPKTYVGTLLIRTSAADAELYLDENFVGKAPLKKPLTGITAGPHILRITKPGFRDVYQFVDVVYNRSSTITVDLNTNNITGEIVEVVSDTGFGLLYVLTDEAAVEIRIDGEPRGITPLETPIDQIPAGKRRVSFRKEGFAAQSQEVEIEKDKRTDLDLRTLEGMLNVGARQVALASAPLPLPMLQLASIPSADGTAGTAASGPAAWESTWRLYAGVVVGGLGVLAFGGTSAFAAKIDTLNAETKAIADEGNGVHGAVTPQRQAELIDRLENKDERGRDIEKYQWISLGSGVVLAGTGVGLILWDLFGDHQGAPLPEKRLDGSPAVTAGVAPAPGGGVLVIRGQW